MKDVKDSLLRQNSHAFENYEEKRQNDHNHYKILYQGKTIHFRAKLHHHFLKQTLIFFFFLKQTLIDHMKLSMDQIFQYLLMCGAQIISSFWLQVIHSRKSRIDS